MTASTTNAPAIPAGMKPWAGGEKAPEDWDGGVALFRDGTPAEYYADGWDWGHHPEDPPHVRAVEIVAYTPRSTPTTQRFALGALVSHNGGVIDEASKRRITGLKGYNPDMGFTYWLEDMAGQSRGMAADDELDPWPGDAATDEVAK